MHARSDSKEKFQDMQFSIDMDSTLHDVMIVLSAEDDLGITLLNPTGKICPSTGFISKTSKNRTVNGCLVRKFSYKLKSRQDKNYTY